MELPKMEHGGKLLCVSLDHQGLRDDFSHHKYLIIYKIFFPFKFCGIFLKFFSRLLDFGPKIYADIEIRTLSQRMALEDERN